MYVMYERKTFKTGIMLKKTILIILLTACFQFSGNAWIYPEHRDIMLLAILKLDSAHRAVLDRLWALARAGHEARLNLSVVDATQANNVKYLDYAAWPGIAGDHSTSADNMIFNILQTDWILDVANITANLKIGIAKSRNRSEIESHLRDSDIKLLKADPEYVSRAGANNVHFMLARPSSQTKVMPYMLHCVREDTSEVNLVGTYWWFHTSALFKAQQLMQEDLTSEQRSLLALSALADEAFAIHFIEDAFAAGHVVGVWGNASLRKGTHDYYDEHGLEVTTWNGDRLVIMGDAWMRPEDAERASRTVMLSLNQVLDAAGKANRLSPSNDRLGNFSPDTFNVAKSIHMPSRKGDPAFKEMFQEVLFTTPMPGLATGAGEIPRFRSELGAFIGFAPALRLNVFSGGFGRDQQKMGAVPGLEVAIHVGLGMEGVLNESGDGLVFLDLGYRLDGPSTVKYNYDPEKSPYGSVISVLPSRDAFYFRFRMPFYVIPGDLLVAGPIVYLASKESFNKMVASAGQGGLVPWQTGLVSSIGRFQFILGREIGVTFNGFILGASPMVIPDPDRGEGAASLISMRSTQLEFPFLEYRPFRSFTVNQSTSLAIQFNAGLDIPGKVTMLDPAGAPAVNLKTIWFLGIRIYFDWRYYFANK
jgi:hypothetical protein